MCNAACFETTYLDVANQLDGLSMLAEVFFLNVSENGHAMAAGEARIERAGREAASSETPLALPVFLFPGATLWQLTQAFEPFVLLLPV